MARQGKGFFSIPPFLAIRVFIILRSTSTMSRGGANPRHHGTCRYHESVCLRDGEALTGRKARVRLVGNTQRGTSLKRLLLRNQVLAGLLQPGKV